MLTAIGRRLSNGEIAAEFGISKRTVESHVAALLTKVGTRTRSGLIAAGAAEVATATATATATPTRTPIVGRTAQLRDLDGRLAAAAAGRGGLVLLSGESGVGKSRLAEEVLTRSARWGARTLVGSCYATTGNPPFAPWVELIERAAASPGRPDTFRRAMGQDAPEIARLVPGLRRSFPDIGPAMDLPAEQGRRLLFHAARDTLHRLAREAPLVVVLEDLHWADESTLLLLEHIAADLNAVPLLVIGTHRDSDADLWPLLVRTLDRLVRARSVQRMAVGRLDSDGVAAMIASLSGRNAPDPVLHLIHARTQGNAFFVEEMLRYLLADADRLDDAGALRADLQLGPADVPDNVRLVVRRRLDDLSAPTRRLLETAAVLGRFFDPALVTRINAEDATDSDAVLAALDEATRAGVLDAVGSDAAGDRVAFVHELVCQTVLSTLSRPRRRRVHLSAATATIAMRHGHLDEHAAEIAHHLSEAGDLADPALLRKYCLLAGRRALAACAHHEALALLERAAETARGTGAERAGVLHTLGHAYRAVGRLEDAELAWQESLRESEVSGDTAAVAAACFDMGVHLIYAARMVEAVAVARRGLAATHPEGGPARALLLALLGAATAWDGDAAASDPPHAEATLLAEASGDPGLTGLVQVFRAASCISAMRVTETVVSGRQGAAAMQAAGELWATVDGTWPVAWALVSLGRFADADEVFRQMIPMAQRIQHGAALVVAHRAGGPRQFYADGDLDAFTRQVHLDIEVGRRLMGGGAWNALAESWLGTIDFWRGDWDVAGPRLRRAAETTPTHGMSEVCWAAWLRHLAYCGDAAGAHAVLDEHRAHLPHTDRPNSAGSWALLFGAVEASAVLGDRRDAAAWYPLVVQARADTGALINPFCSGQLIERVAGIAATAAGEHARAETHFRRAAAQADDLPHQVERWETRRWFAALLRERDQPGDRAYARALAAEAAAGYQSLGMDRHADMAHQDT